MCAKEYVCHIFSLYDSLAVGHEKSEGVTPPPPPSHPGGTPRGYPLRGVDGKRGGGPQSCHPSSIRMKAGRTEVTKKTSNCILDRVYLFTSNILCTAVFHM